MYQLKIKCLRRIPITNKKDNKRFWNLEPTNRELKPYMRDEAAHTIYI